MNLLINLKDTLVDFLFPKSDRVLELEKLSIETLVEKLPKADETKDNSIIALFDYGSSLVKEIIWEVKYKGNSRLAEKLGVILYDVILNEISERNLFEKWGAPLLVPIPMSEKRRIERGWNQAEILAEMVMKQDKSNSLEYLPRQLVKIRHTESQIKTRSGSERLNNLADSMEVLDSQNFAGKSVILIDDVTTTGATFSEARRALKSIGVKKILCVAFAH